MSQSSTLATTPRRRPHEQIDKYELIYIPKTVREKRDNMKNASSFDKKLKTNGAET